MTEIIKVLSELTGVHGPAGKTVLLHFPDRNIKPGLECRHFYAFCIILFAHSNIECRAAVLKLESPGGFIKTQTPGPHPWSVWFTWSRLKSKNLHF